MTTAGTTPTPTTITTPTSTDDDAQDDDDKAKSSVASRSSLWSLSLFWTNRRHRRAVAKQRKAYYNALVSRKSKLRVAARRTAATATDLQQMAQIQRKRRLVRTLLASSVIAALAYYLVVPSSLLQQQGGFMASWLVVKSKVLATLAPTPTKAASETTPKLGLLGLVVAAVALGFTKTMVVAGN